MLLNFLQYTGQPLTTKNNLAQPINVSRLRNPSAIYKRTKKCWSSKPNSFSDTSQLRSGQAACRTHLSDPKACMCFFGYKMPCSRAAAHQVPSVLGENKRHCFSLHKQAGISPPDQKPMSTDAAAQVQARPSRALEGCRGVSSASPLQTWDLQIWDLTQVAAVCTRRGAWSVSVEGVAQMPMASEGLWSSVGIRDAAQRESGTRAGSGSSSGASLLRDKLRSWARRGSLTSRPGRGRGRQGSSLAGGR